MARSLTKRPTNIRKKRTWSRQEGEGLHPSNAQPREGVKGKEHEPKSLYVLHATRVKHPLERIVESNKHEGNRNGLKARKEQIQTEVEHT